MPRSRQAPLAVAAVLASLLALAGCGGQSGGQRSHSQSQTPTQPRTQPQTQLQTGRMFAPTSFWNQPLGSDQPLDPRSQALVAGLLAQVKSEQASHSGPWINVSNYGVPIVTVGANQATVSVKLIHAPDPALSRAWRSVPLPSSAQPSTGHDRYMVVWQPSTDRMWEFWQLRRSGSTWEASWGGAMEHVSQNKGVYGADAWPGAKPYWGATATSFPLAGGAMTIAELKRGQINHVLALSIPNVRAGEFAAPAQRTDGNDPSANALPEGARLRLDPRLDLAKLNMPRLTRMIAEAAQRYGIVIRDYSSIIAFDAQDPQPGQANPYAGPTGIYGGMFPSELLASFPWNHLQVVRMQLQRSAG